MAGRGILTIILWTLGLLTLWALVRAGFMVFHPTLLQDHSWLQLAQTFAHGARFDLAALLIFNSGLFLFWLWAHHLRSPRWVHQVHRIAFIALNLMLLVHILAEAEVSRVTGQREPFFYQAIAAEYFAQPLSLFKTYGVHLVMGILLIAVITFMYNWPLKITAPLPPTSRWKGLILASANTLLVAAFAVVGIRGGFQGKPLSPISAGTLRSSQLIQIAVSSPYLIVRNSSQTLERVEYFEAAELPAKMGLPDPTQPEHFGLLAGDNVVVIILESMGREYMGWGNPWPGFTPFLDELAEKGVSFPHSFANGAKSIDVLPSLFAGLPAWLPDTYVNSQFATNHIVGLPQLFAERGYQSAFFHGGNRGTMHFDVTAKLLGFQNEFNRQDYPRQEEDFDGIWGIFDGPYLKYFFEETSRAREPFFHSVLTLSSHHPYNLPAELKEHYEEGSHPIHKVVRYTDDSLREFFELASQSEWFSRTLFVITADHTSVSQTKEYQGPLGRFRVPILFYHPGKELPPVPSERVAQHIDIPATLSELFGLEAPWSRPLGRSLFDGDPKGLAINRTQAGFWLTSGSRALWLSEEGEADLFETADYLLTEPLAGEEELKGQLKDQLQAYLQFYFNGLLDNSHFPPQPTGSLNPGKAY